MRYLLEIKVLEVVLGKKKRLFSINKSRFISGIYSFKRVLIVVLEF